jgi:fumarylacetoacetase
MALNKTHQASARSWVASANQQGTDFPIQNLPFAVFRLKDSNNSFRGGVAIGDQIVDLAALSAHGAFKADAPVASALAAASKTSLNEFMAMGHSAWSALRHALFDALEQSAKGPRADAVRASLVPQTQAQYTVPTHIQDYTDFYTSIHHAANIGKLFRPDADFLTPNFKWLPIAYHGRASSICMSGENFHRPMGQYLAAPPAAGVTPVPVYGPCKRLDFELELGVFVGPGNRLGDQISIDDAEQHMFGICLLNDWSARDIQGWEYQPLGPFLGKNFATSISPWIVTMEALAPYRQAWERPSTDPQPLAYLDSTANRERGAIDIQLTVSLESPAHRAKNTPAAQITKTSFKHQYWSVAQMLAHHTVGGCNMNAGDLFGSGTISGPTASEAGALIELSKGGKEPVKLHSAGAEVETRGFLQDGDAVILKGWCEKPGAARIGFGECRGEVLGAKC